MEYHITRDAYSVNIKFMQLIAGAFIFEYACINSDKQNKYANAKYLINLNL